MKKVLVIAAVTALAAAAYGAWVYEGKWGTRGSGNGQFEEPGAIGIAANGNVYIGDQYNHRIQYFTSTGSFLGKWGKYGTGDGEFNRPVIPKVAPNGNVYVTDYNNHRIQYFTSTGSFLGKWGKTGTGNGEFQGTKDLAFTSNGARCYVIDGGNHRVQYFKDTEHAVAPESLGKVKALFR